MSHNDRRREMIEDVIRSAEDALVKKDLVGAMAARKVFMYITREIQHGDQAYLTMKYQEICTGIDELIDTSEEWSLSNTKRGIVVD